MAISESNITTLLNDVIRLYEQERLSGAITTSTNNQNGTAIYNWISKENVFFSDLGTLAGAISNTTDPGLTDIAAAVRQTRATKASIMSQSARALAPAFRIYGQFINAPETDVQSIITRLTKYYVDNSEAVNSRGFVYGAQVNGSPYVGNGAVYRLIWDENGFPIENNTAEVKTLTCLADASSGARGRNEEIFEIRGAVANRDALDITGSGSIGQLTAMNASMSFAYLRNPSFSQFSGTTSSPTDITQWTSSVAVSSSTYTLTTDTYANQGVGYYRDYPGDSTSYSLNCLSTTFTLSQSIEQNRNAFSPNNPMYCQFAYKKSSVGTDGTLTLSLGSNTASVTLGGIGDTNWHVLSLALDKNLWFRNFDQANLSFSIARSGGTTGTITVDDVILAPFAFFDGLWWAVVGGTTPFLRRDTLTFTDTENGENYGTNQKWLWRSFARYLPSAVTPPSTAAAAALAGAGAGNIDNGTHSYKVQFKDTNGRFSVTNSASNSVNVVDKTTNGKISVSSIPVGPQNTAARLVYRTKAGGSTYFLLTTISDNVTTTYSDNTADASLGATYSAPQAITWSDAV